MTKRPKTLIEPETENKMKLNIEVLSTCKIMWHKTRSNEGQYLFTIPLSVVKQFNLNKKDVIQWCFNPNDNTIILRKLS